MITSVILFPEGIIILMSYCMERHAKTMACATGVAQMKPPGGAWSVLADCRIAPLAFAAYMTGFPSTALKCGQAHFSSHHG